MSKLFDESRPIKAPKIIVNEPIYATQFYAKRVYDAFGILQGYAKRVYDEYAILLPPRDHEIAITRKRRKIENTIPDDCRLAEYLFSMIYFRQGVSPGNQYPYLNVEKCLDYHYEKYSGDKLKFIEFTQNQLTVVLYSQFEGSSLHDNTKKRIDDWCNIRRSELVKTENTFSTLNIENNALHQPQQNLPGQEANYCLTPETKIVSLFKAMNGTVFNGITLPQFIECFDRNNIPATKPTYEPGKENVMVFALTFIDNIDKHFASSNFGIANFTNEKSKRKVPGTNPPVFKLAQSNRGLESKITTIFNVSYSQS